MFKRWGCSIAGEPSVTRRMGSNNWEHSPETQRRRDTETLTPLDAESKRQIDTETQRSRKAEPETRRDAGLHISRHASPTTLLSPSLPPPLLTNDTAQVSNCCTMLLLVSCRSCFAFVQLWLARVAMPESKQFPCGTHSTNALCSPIYTSDLVPER